MQTVQVRTQADYRRPRIWCVRNSALTQARLPSSIKRILMCMPLPDRPSRPARADSRVTVAAENMSKTLRRGND